ncbi:RNA polymerase ECF-type sigma factor [Flavobacteriaceae bacterium 3519-10]|nr:RNA polymerase ECF-type sigma factor [Flavobacteriaceae bacterium 3519-10]
MRHRGSADALRHLATEKFLEIGLKKNLYSLLKFPEVLSAKEQEFSKLIKDNQGLIIKVSRLYTNSLEDEQDLFQEIVLQLWRSYDTFKGQSKISTWMYRVALNTAITLFRKKTKSPQTDELMDFHHSGYIEDDDEKQQQISLLYKVVKMLPHVERAIVMMYLDDLPYRDISENLGITEVNARVKMNRLKKTLKQLMEKHA